MLNLSHNLALTLTSQQDANSYRNPISTVNIPKHRTLTIALTLRTYPTMDIDVTHVSLFTVIQSHSHADIRTEY